MTIIYTDLCSVTSLRKGIEGGFKFNQTPITSYDALVEAVLNEYEPFIDAPSMTPASEMQTLAACLSRLGEDVVWQLKILGDRYSYPATPNQLIDEELLFIYSQLQHIHQKMDNAIQTLTKAKVKALKDNLKINLGAGKFKIDGWVNVDVYPAELPYNVLWGLPFENQSAQFIHSAYLLEHLNYKKEALILLQEIWRVLQPGGVLRLTVPNIRPFMLAYLENDQDFFEQVEAKWGFSFGGTLLQKVLNYAGVGHKPGVVDDHKFGYDDETLSMLLMEAGFSSVYPSSYMQSTFNELQVDLDPLSSEIYNGTPLCLIYEAVK